MYGDDYYRRWGVKDFLAKLLFFFSSRRRHTSSKRDWSSDVCSSDLLIGQALGGPAGWWSLPWVLAAAVLFALGVRQLRREGSDIWVFFLTTCVLAPGLYVLMRPPYLFERYFFVPLTFFLLLAARAVSFRGTGGPLVSEATGGPPVPRESWRMPVTVVLLFVFLLGNGLTVWRFVQTGRGDFYEALAWVLDEDHSETVRVTSEHEPRDEHGKRRGAPFRTEKYVGFYRQLFPDRDVLFVDADAHWLFVHRL